MKEIYMELSKSHENLAKTYYKLAQGQNVETKEESLSVEKLRVVLSDKLKNGKKNEIKELLKKYKAEKLSDVVEEDYKAFFIDVNKL